MLPNTAFLPTLFLSRLLFLSTLLVGGIMVSCEPKEASENQEEQSVFELLLPEQTRVDFTNTVEENETFNMVDFFYVYNGGGVAIGDVNNDSLPDLFFTGNMVNDRLYINSGNTEELQFTDISQGANIQSSGWSTGVTMVDINTDGLLDIYVCRSGNYPAEQRKNKLLINNGINPETGQPTFTEAAEDYGLADTSYSTQSVFFDYDRDGDLDMYLLNHTNAIRNPNQVRPLVSDGTGLANDRLYRNNGADPSQNTTFTDVTVEAGILYDGLGLGVSVSDVNNDGWPDIFVTNDFVASDYLYINNQDGTGRHPAFSQQTENYLGHVSHFSMGHDVADFTNDGLPDLITVDMLPRDNEHRKKMSGPMNYNLFEYTLQQGYMPQYMRNTVQVNLGNIVHQQPKFAEVGQLLNMHATDWSWSPLIADFDNDGWKDMFITNGYLRDITDLDFINYTAGIGNSVSPDSLDTILKQKARQMPSIKLANFVFQNKGALRFEDVSRQWGIDQPSLSNGAAYGDLDRDGDLDLVVNNINEAAFIYLNHTNKFSENNFLRIWLVGDSLNPNGIGAKVSIYTSDKQQFIEQSVSRGYQSSMDYLLHAGLGKQNKVDSIVVQWPDGKIARQESVNVNQEITIDYQDAEFAKKNNLPISNSWFSEVTKSLNINYQHKDPEYDDFSRQYLLPHKLSEQGPGIAVGDVNGDEREDFFMGGAYSHAGSFFLQQPDGTFQEKKLSSEEKYEEDLGVLLFDYDGDSDLDLYIASGSNEHYENSEYYQDRLYRNDGRGNFTLTKDMLPLLRSSATCVRATDIDADGDLDLFVGGGSIPLKYPLPPDSYLLINEGGVFTDKTLEQAPDLRRLGMVKDALWTDFDNDADADLIIVGEFMPIQFFRNNQGKLENVSSQTGLKYTSGWWNSINGGDFDQDGDTDYILGNIGLNTAYKVSPDEPMTIYAADLDQNGFVDPIITAYINHQESPIPTRDDLIRQVPALKKKFTSYANYAEATIADVLTPADKSRAYTAKAFQFASSYLENTGNGRFKLTELPLMAQWSPVYGILVQDFTADGFLDVVLTGNDFSPETITGRYDASVGTLLPGDGTGNFTAVAPTTSGLVVPGNARGVATLQLGNQWAYLFAKNSDSLQVYSTAHASSPKNFVTIPLNALKATVTFADSSQWVQEFYYGSSYLSQSSRKLPLSGQETEVRVTYFDGKEEVITP
ncbi:VCBS repeat-containing protein [Tunicatimonas pelagia]|uniref:VCBS repeat-containing protein n=1 Tax=Tunicatimonas pelagia TaxID=931531 RepID=UPI002665DE6E|nr:VCBS repeat-containing protein [Tunicatimonas pelagia]WKN43726.1 VCBS repeat-containing protein [Tunicatimonas pelagia]